jgi:hypothetical protein
MMLAVENALKDFERDLNSGAIKNLDAASSRVGRLIGESVVAQSIIYAMMKRDGDEPETKPNPDPDPISQPVGVDGSSTNTNP